MYFNREDYGSRIRSLRKKRGLTQEQLAEKMNVSTPYIAKIETGKHVEFAAFFEVSLDYLLVGKGDFAEEQKRGLRMAISLLSELEASDWHGSGQPVEYVPDLRRRFCRQDAPADGLYQPSRRGGRSVVQTWRDVEEGCRGLLQKIISKEVRTSGQAGCQGSGN